MTNKEHTLRIKTVGDTGNFMEFNLKANSEAWVDGEPVNLNTLMSAERIVKALLGAGHTASSFHEYGRHVYEVLLSHAHKFEKPRAQLGTPRILKGEQEYRNTPEAEEALKLLHVIKDRANSRMYTLKQLGAQIVWLLNEGKGADPTKRECTSVDYTASEFYLVKNLNGGATNHIHPTFEAADTEAKRLATINHSQVFAVFAAVKAYKTKPIELEDVGVMKKETK